MMSESTASVSYWLLKSEPDPHVMKGVDLSYPVERFLTEKDQVGRYTGVRNLQARGFLRDKMKPGDLCFFYHSSCKTPGIAGIVEVVRAAIPDDDALNPDHPLYDEKHTPEKPRWFCCDVKLVRLMKQFVSLAELRANSAALGDMLLLRQPRLSVQPVKATEWQTILNIEEKSCTDGPSAVPKPVSSRKSTPKTSAADEESTSNTALSGKKRKRTSTKKAKEEVEEEEEE